MSKWHYCDFCSYKTTRSYNLGRHRNSQHGGPLIHRSFRAAASPLRESFDAPQGSNRPPQIQTASENHVSETSPFESANKELNRLAEYYENLNRFIRAQNTFSVLNSSRSYSVVEAPHISATQMDPNNIMGWNAYRCQLCGHYEARPLTFFLAEKTIVEMPRPHACESASGQTRISDLNFDKIKNKKDAFVITEFVRDWTGVPPILVCMEWNSTKKLPDINTLELGRLDRSDLFSRAAQEIVMSVSFDDALEFILRASSTCCYCRFTRKNKAKSYFIMVVPRRYFGTTPIAPKVAGIKNDPLGSYLEELRKVSEFDFSEKLSAKVANLKKID